MPRYFFNVRHRPGPAGLAQDPEGEELADANAARERALTVARAMIARDQFATIRDRMDCSFEITESYDGVDAPRRHRCARVAALRHH